MYYISGLGLRFFLVVFLFSSSSIMADDEDYGFL